MICSPTPDWELLKADFDIEYTDMNKEENPIFLSYIVKSHLTHNYSNHFKIYTDGSVLENEQAGAEFVIPEIKTIYIYIKKKRRKKRFLISKGKIYIYCRISCTINAFMIIIVNLSMTSFSILFCVDSNAVLYLLHSKDSKVRSDIIYVIMYLVHRLLIKRY